MTMLTREQIELMQKTVAMGFGLVMDCADAQQVLDEIAALRAQLAACEQERDRLREICEAATEEVIEYANVSGIPSGRPTEPSLPESIRQLKHDLRQQLAASEQRVKELEEAITPVTTMLTDLEIVPLGCSREQELAWKKAVKDLRQLVKEPEEVDG